MEAAEGNEGRAIGDDAHILEADEADEETNARGNRELKGLRNVADDPATERSDRDDQEENAINHNKAHGLREVIAKAEHDVVSDQGVKTKTGGKPDGKFAVESHEDCRSGGRDSGGGEDSGVDVTDGCPCIPINKDISYVANNFGIGVANNRGCASPVGAKHARVERQDVEHREEDDESANEFL